MRPRGDQRYEQLRAQWRAEHPSADPEPSLPFQWSDAGAFDEAPCPSGLESWYYLSPPGDDGAMTEAWSRSGARVQQTVDYQHTLTAIKAFCDYCPAACKKACLQLRLDQEEAGMLPAAGVYGGTLFLDSGRKVTREVLENRAHKQEVNARTAEAKRRARAAVRARGGDEGTAA